MASIVAIQSLSRRRMAEAALQRARQNRAAVAIQSAWRGHRALASFAATRNCCIAIQRVYRGCAVRERIRRRRRNAAALAIQSAYRGWRARRDYREARQGIVVLQSYFRRKLARAEYAQLKAEARSVRHFKNISYNLENKVFKLTQSLSQRTAENKQLRGQITGLELQLTRSQETCAGLEKKGLELEKRLHQLEAEARGEARQLQADCSHLQAQCKALEAEVEGKDARVRGLETELDGLRRELGRAEEELRRAEEQAAIGPGAVAGEKHYYAEDGLLGGEVAQNGSTTPLPRSPSLVSSRESGGANAHPRNFGAVYNSAPQYYRGSYDGTARYLSPLSPDLAAKRNTISGFQDLYLQNGSPQPAFSHDSDTFSDQQLSNSDSQKLRILLQNDSLLSEIIDNLIRQISVPLPTPHSLPLSKEILFPAHMIGITLAQMRVHELSAPMKNLLNRLKQTIQRTKFDGDFICAFWTANIAELIAIIKSVGGDAIRYAMYPPEGDELDPDRVMYEVRSELENILLDIFEPWLKDLKKRLARMIIPGVVEHQSLPGYTTNESGFFKNLMSNTTTTIDTVVNFFSKLWSIMEFYYVEESIMKEITADLLNFVGSTAFNHILMRKNFNSWKRGMQIQYNVTRMEEWWKSKDAQLPLHLERLMQAAKLLQLQKVTIEDIQIMFDVCYLLNPAQIKKLISMYTVSDYEHPISPDILQEIANRSAISEKQDPLFLEPVPFERFRAWIQENLNKMVLFIDNFIPQGLHVPRLRAIVQASA